MKKKSLSIATLFCLFFTFSLFSAEERPFIYDKPYERAQEKRCSFNLFRGDDCISLLQKLCQRVQFQNRQCRLFSLKECHRIHGLDKGEEKCEQGIMFEHCYGNKAKCFQEEKEACKILSYGDRYCGRYQWLDCTEEKFRTKKCKKFHNDTMIKYYEDKIADRLLWEPRGQKSVRQQIESLKQSLENIGQALDKMEEEHDSVSGKIKDYLGDFFGIEALKKRKKELEKNISDAKKAQHELSIKLKENEHMNNLCTKFSPWQIKSQP